MDEIADGKISISNSGLEQVLAICDQAIQGLCLPIASFIIWVIFLTLLCGCEDKGDIL